MDQRINEHIQDVWQDYDQRLKISLEQERILVQFYDPQCKYASYYEMQERSQGCQTFISFLLTIGAEAKQGVIRNTVLLLDEPENHLHPSGVRFMLQELIKAAQNDNKVIFATHSIFMIDRDCYNRHVIVTKEKEQTKIRPSSQDRIGFFMQEEVLYSTLDIDLNKDFDSMNRYNFVFEGAGDARLFEHFYSLLGKKEQPFKADMTTFHQGGKCSSIKKYFTRKPIQLGSVWVFILDSDDAANELKRFLEGKYQNFLNKYIFIFQYEREDWLDKKIEVEMEDLLPDLFVKQALKDAASELSEDGELTEFISKIDNSTPFGKYFKEICLIATNEEFKGTVKRVLNSSIAEQIEQMDTKAKLDETFKAYSSWAQTVIETIKSFLESDGKQNATSKKVKKNGQKATPPYNIETVSQKESPSSKLGELNKKTD